MLRHYVPACAYVRRFIMYDIGSTIIYFDFRIERVFRVDPSVSIFV